MGRWREEEYSYKDVDAASTELAHHLKALGAGPDVVIGLLMERCPQIYVAMLGIMKAGAAHVPLVSLPYFLQDQYPSLSVCCSVAKWP